MPPRSTFGATPFRNAKQRRADHIEKREAVLRAAVRIFNSQGYHAASLDDVATALQISKPTIYHYVGNKERVLLECLMRGLKLLQAAADSALDAKSGNGLERLRAFLVRYAEINMQDFGRCVIRTSEEMLSAEGAERFRELKRRIDLSIRSLIEAGVADGSITPVNVRLAAFSLAGALNSPALWYDPAGPIAAREIASEMVTLLFNGMEAR